MQITITTIIIIINDKNEMETIFEKGGINESNGPSNNIDLYVALYKKVPFDHYLLS